MSDTPCERCGGHGWSFVSERWVDQQAPDRPDLRLVRDQLHQQVENYRKPPPAEQDPAELHTLTARYSAAWHEAEQAIYARATATNSVYPCPVCNTDTFERWSGGHYRATHDPHSCTTCIDNGWGTSKKKART